jgi:hypothetical protein
VASQTNVRRSEGVSLLALQRIADVEHLHQFARAGREVDQRRADEDANENKPDSEGKDHSPRCGDRDFWCRPPHRSGHADEDHGDDQCPKRAVSEPHANARAASTFIDEASTGSSTRVWRTEWAQTPWRFTKWRHSRSVCLRCWIKLTSFLKVSARRASDGRSRDSSGFSSADPGPA